MKKFYLTFWLVLEVVSLLALLLFVSTGDLGIGLYTILGHLFAKEAEKEYKEYA